MYDAAKRTIAGIALAACFAVSANADPITVNPTSDGSWVEASADCSFCSIDTILSDGLDAATATLELDESWKFDFFDIVVGGVTLGADATIQATLAFLEPEAMSAASGTGSFFTFFGIVSGGSLYWDQPAVISLDDGSYLHVRFEDLYEIGFGNRTTVSATVLHSDSIRVAEPGTLALFGLGLFGLGLAWRRRNAR